MENKIRNRYIIDTEEFSAMDYSFKKRHFLKEIAPELHEDINAMWEKALKIEEINNIYPETYVNNSRTDIFDKYELPSIIPIEVIKEYKDNYYKCIDLFTKNKFIIPSELICEKFKPMDMYALDLFLIKHGDDNINICLNRFAEELNPPRKVRRKLKKDTK